MIHDYRPLHFESLYTELHARLLEAPAVPVGHWQALDVSNDPLRVTHELQNVVFTMPMTRNHARLVDEVQPNMPWAADHFRERISGEPLNPGEQYKNWPWYRGNVEQHQTQEDKLFSHTYMERFWPKRAGHMGQKLDYERMGIRFPYGDLNDVINLLYREPLTRQAYLPVWFPEDTGAAHGERVPCTLGYHFFMRKAGSGPERLHINYFIRSCDLLRHFRDDVYLAVRLATYVADYLVLRLGSPQVDLGDLTMFMSSLHVFAGDLPRMKREAKEWARQEYEQTVTQEDPPLSPI